MDELFRFLFNFFLDMRRLSAALILILASGLTIVWVSIEVVNSVPNSDRWAIGSIVASLLVVSAALIFDSLRHPLQAPKPSFEQKTI